ncbi:MAG: helix-turn-helix transcriptional regulator [Planctomycetota bacterium]|nr:helix-turn-helix transcriptional regulator [Planctomycetota bacterium]
MDIQKPVRAYRWELLPKLATEIEYGRRAGARRDLAELLAIFVRQSGPDLTLRKLRCAQTASACLRGARCGGAPSAALLQEHLAFLRRLSGLRSWAGVCRAMRGYVDGLIARVKPAGRNRMERVVASIREDLRAGLADPRTLAQYAAELELSEGHLSRCFAEIAGRPFREEVRRLRSEAARADLLTTRRKVGEIARRVGLRSASQFVADFKRQTGVTPGQFRRMAQRKT